MEPWQWLRHPDISPLEEDQCLHDELDAMTRQGNRLKFAVVPLSRLQLPLTDVIGDS
eukprot:m.15250 g.15250  ORF g.15250 m.15250 type:complete len:57 (+) comp10496_c0_seq1:1022-1192(+)